MPSLPAHQALIAPDVLLDGRLALCHRREGWLAVADLHFGYELSQRAAGGLHPLWGMSVVRDRLLALLGEHQPQRLIIIGDLVHDRASARETTELLDSLRACCETLVICGNHDRELARRIPMLPSWQTDAFYFHHGHCQADAGDRIQIIGHHHPAAIIRDGAGLRVKCPAFVQQARCWVMPAFSPWASGTPWPADNDTRIWLCTPQRVLPLNELATPPAPSAPTCNAGTAAP